MPYRVDGGVGRYEFTTWRVAGPAGSFNAAVDLFPQLHGKARYRTHWFRRHAWFDHCTGRSYRKTCAALNQIRCQPQATTVRTLVNAAAQEAAAVAAARERQATAVLAGPHFGPTGQPLVPLTPTAAHLLLQEPDAVAAAIAACAWPLTPGAT